MKITKEDIDQVSSYLTLTIEQEDYTEKLEGELKKARKEARIPGFRPGKVPMGIIKRMFYENALGSQLNTILQESLNKYIEENNIDLLFAPVESRDQKPLEIKDQTEFEFKFELGLRPKIDFQVLENLVLPYYNITIDEELLNKEVENYQKHHAILTEMEQVEMEDLIEGEIVELDENGEIKPEGVHYDIAKFFLPIFKDNDEKQKFIGKQISDSVDFDIKKALPNDNEIAGVLGIDKNNVKNLNNFVRIKISRIERYIPAELNEDLFSKVFPNEDIKTIDEFKDKVKAIINKVLIEQSEDRFEYDFAKVLFEVLEFKLPENVVLTLLKNRKEETEETIETSLPLVLDHLRKSTIIAQVTKEHDVKVTDADIENQLRNKAHRQLEQFGINYQQNRFADYLVTELRKKQEEIDAATEYFLYDKTIELLKPLVQKAEQTISFEDFQKLYKQNNENDTPELDENTTPELVEETSEPKTSLLAI